MKEVCILSAVRTPIGSFGGSLKDISAVNLGALVVKEAIQRAGISVNDVDDLLFGCVLQAGLGQNVARQVAVHAELPHEVPALTLNQVCGSGLRAVMMGAQAIRSGESEVVIVGGTENMSQSKYVVQNARWGARMGNQELTDTMIQDGLWDAFHDYHMGQTAENVAAKYSLTREEQDQFALESQKKALQAIQTGAFQSEIVAVPVPQRKGDPILFSQDEYPRDTTLEKLAGLKPAFQKNGTVTAGNASGLNDGAAAFVLTSTEKAKQLGIEPLAILRSFATVGVDPQIMGIGPVPASKKALKQAGWNVKDLDLIEANEAFAAQALAVSRELELDPSKTNIHGGAIALGHPIGASGARILVTLVHALRSKNLHKGLATLCVGGGMGVALTVER